MDPLVSSGVYVVHVVEANPNAMNNYHLEMVLQLISAFFGWFMVVGLHGQRLQRFETCRRQLRGPDAEFETGRSIVLCMSWM